MVRSQARRRGQSLVEFAMVIPALMLLMLGSADLARAFYLDIEISGASRAGLRNGVITTANDVGAAARSEPNSAIANNVATWADTGPGGINADCTSATQHCGDPAGCPAAVFTGTRTACFAIRTCLTSNPDGTCATYSLWNIRPTQNSAQRLDVRVVYKFTPITPVIAQFAGAGGSFYLTVDTLGPELY